MTFDPAVNDPGIVDPNNPPGMRPVLLKSDNTNLLGTFFIAGGAEKKPTVIMLHGFPGNENNFDIAHAVCRLGWNVLVFHYRGTWGSKGIFTWQNAINDVANVVESVKNGWLSEDLKVDINKIVMVGHSMGGFFAAWSLVKGLVNDAFVIGLFNIGFVGELITDNEMFQNIALESLVRDSNFVNIESPDSLLEEMISNGSTWNLISYGKILSEKNFYMIAGNKDQTSPLDLHHNPLMNVLKKVNPQKDYGKVLEAGHSFSNKRIEITRDVINWLNKIEFERGK